MSRADSSFIIGASGFYMFLYKESIDQKRKRKRRLISDFD